MYGIIWVDYNAQNTICWMQCNEYKKPKTIDIIQCIRYSGYHIMQFRIVYNALNTIQCLENNAYNTMHEIKFIESNKLTTLHWTQWIEYNA